MFNISIIKAPILSYNIKGGKDKGFNKAINLALRVYIGVTLLISAILIL